MCPHGSRATVMRSSSFGAGKSNVHRRTQYSFCSNDTTHVFSYIEYSSHNDIDIKTEIWIFIKRKKQLIKKNVLFVWVRILHCHFSAIDRPPEPSTIGFFAGWVDTNTRRCCLCCELHSWECKKSSPVGDWFSRKAKRVMPLELTA